MAIGSPGPPYGSVTERPPPARCHGRFRGVRGAAGRSGGRTVGGHTRRTGPDTTNRRRRGLRRFVARGRERPVTSVPGEEAESDAPVRSVCARVPYGRRCCPDVAPLPPGPDDPIAGEAGGCRGPPGGPQVGVQEGWPPDPQWSRATASSVASRDGGDRQPPPSGGCAVVAGRGPPGAGVRLPNARDGGCDAVRQGQAVAEAVPIRGPRALRPEALPGAVRGRSARRVYQRTTRRSDRRMERLLPGQRRHATVAPPGG
jgi:hypothetical protein